MHSGLKLHTTQCGMIPLGLFVLLLASGSESSCVPPEGETPDCSPLGPLCASSDGHLLGYVSVKKSWQAARSFCLRCDVAKVSGDLVIDTTTETNSFLDAQTSGNSLWIGGNSLSGAWQWVNGESIPVGSGKSPRWAAKEPNNKGGQQHCMVANYIDHQWDDQGCSIERNFVCQYDMVVYKTNWVSGRVLKYISTPLAFKEARDHCKGTNGTLVIADTKEISAWLGMQGGKVWVGATDGAAGANWVWRDGSGLPSDSEHWAVAPDHLCALYSSEGLRSQYCLEEHPFACEIRYPDC